MARGKEKVFSFVELDERTSIQKLGVIDQIRALLKSLFNDDAKELRREDILTKEYLQLKANLVDFVEKSTEPIRKGEHSKVEMEISNKFDPVMEEVFGDKKLTRYYDITIKRPNIPYDIAYNVSVRMEVKS